MSSPNLSGFEVTIHEEDREINTDGDSNDVDPTLVKRDELIPKKNESKIYKLNNDDANVEKDAFSPANEQGKPSCDNGVPPCNQCASCMLPVYLARQQEKAEKVKGLVCDICGEIFSKSESLKVHREVIHEAVRYQCQECNYEAVRWKALKSHRKYMHTEKKYSCDFCGYKHAVLNRVTFHVAEMHGEKYINCDSCEFSAATQRGLNRHMYRKHRRVVKRIGCEYCEFTSVWKSDVKRHIESKHNEVKSFKCSECPYLAKNPRCLQRHMEKHAGKIFNCIECEFTSVTTQGLKYHTREKHCEAERVKCTECEYEAPAGWRIKRHMDEKHGKQLFQCSVCGEKVKSKSALYNHKVRDHSQFVCSICHIEETSKYLMTKHFATHTGSDETNSACDQCTFVGKNKRSLQYHQKKHKGEYYFCQKCDYSSPTLEQLKSHSNFKHGESRFECEHCHLKFKANWILMQHRDRKHSNTSGETFSCEKCDFSSTSTVKIQSHYDYKHGELKFNCVFCELKFRTKAMLKQHFARKHKMSMGKESTSREETLFEVVEVKQEVVLSNMDAQVENMFKLS